MNRIMPQTVAIFAAVVALIVGFAFVQTKAEAGINSNPDLRVAVACSPLTSSQTALPGDSQLCRTRFTNMSAYPITGITFSRPSLNTLTDRYGYNSPMLDCDATGCEPFTLAPGQQAYVFEEMTFNAYEDGRGRTIATASGTQVIERLNKPTVYQAINSWGNEQSSLP